LRSGVPRKSAARDSALRIAFVNALSHPEFTGGATLQVHRVAVALQDAGNEVAIFSGARRAGSADFAPAHHIADGVDVTSINTDKYFAFGDGRNFDNPDAGARLLEWLDKYDPDVVHAHSLQGLGASWVREAASRRPVLVTMHDWWWICSRQFLVDEEMELDWPLVDTTGCACSGGVEYNRERRAWLAEQLAAASRVLVPSDTLRDSLGANGYDAGCVVVDPNGLPPAPGSVTPRSNPEPLLGFVGGWHDFKGLPLLAQACEQIGSPLPFQLACWGVDESPASARLPTGTQLHPAFEEGGAYGVMAALDALVVPSVMRESFSIVTREALAAGTPVICSDSGGPEEVVEHGRNGLVFESNNARELARWLGRWAEDPELRRGIGDGARAGSPGDRTIAQHAAALLGHYEDATGDRAHAPRRVAVGAGPNAPTASPAVAAPGGRTGAGSTGEVPGKLVLVTGIEGAPLRYRGLQLLDAHRALGGEAAAVHFRDRRIPGLVEGAAMVIFYRVPWSAWVRDCLRQARDSGASVVFSVDDLVFEPALRDRIPAVRQLPGPEAELWMEGVNRYRATAEACGVFLGSTPALADAGRAIGLQAFVHPNFMGRELALLSQAALRVTREQRAQRHARATCRIGYLSGTTTHDDDWMMVEPAVRAVLEAGANNELWLVGPVGSGSLSIDQHPRARRIGYLPYQELPRLHAELDIVLAPLEPGLEFSEAKSAVKWLEASAMGVPVVASPTGPFRDVIDDGRTGVLAEPGAWEEAIRGLTADPLRRESIGRAARREAYRGWGPWSEALHWQGLWPRLLAATGPAAAPDADRWRGDRPTAMALEPEAPGLYPDQLAPKAEAVTPPLGNELTLAAEITPRYVQTARVDVMTSAFGRPPAGALQLRLVRDGRVLRQGTVAAAEIADDGWTAWEFAPLDTPGAVRLEISQPLARERGGVAAWHSLDGRHFEAGAARAGDLCVRTWAAPSRLEVSAIAGGEPATARPGKNRTAMRTARVLWHKGRHSLRSRGARDTVFQVIRYGQRLWRGRRRS
jgi:glycosyltransferase involved in cell wall biosynthesis